MTCLDCSFQSVKFHDAIVHVLVDAHNLTLPIQSKMSPWLKHAAMQETKSEEENEIGSRTGAEFDANGNEALDIPVFIKASTTTGTLAQEQDATEKRIVAKETECLTKCNNCGKRVMLQKYNLCQHMRYCLKIRPYSCSKCKFKSGNKEKSKDHVYRKCRGAILLVKERINEALDARKWQCFPNVNVSFAREESGVACSEAETKPSQNIDKTVKEGRKEKKVKESRSSTSLTKCSKCNKLLNLKGKFFYAETVRRHMLSCLNIRPYSCSHCRGKWTYLPTARIHVKNKCPGATVVAIKRDTVNKALQKNKWQCFPNLDVKFVRTDIELETGDVAADNASIPNNEKNRLEQISGGKRPTDTDTVVKHDENIQTLSEQGNSGIDEPEFPSDFALPDQKHKATTISIIKQIESPTDTVNGTESTEFELPLWQDQGESVTMLHENIIEVESELEESQTDPIIAGSPDVACFKLPSISIVSDDRTKSPKSTSSDENTTMSDAWLAEKEAADEHLDEGFAANCYEIGDKETTEYHAPPRTDANDSVYKGATATSFPDEKSTEYDAWLDEETTDRKTKPRFNDSDVTGSKPDGQENETKISESSSSLINVQDSVKKLKEQLASFDTKGTEAEEYDAWLDENEIEEPVNSIKPQPSSSVQLSDTAAPRNTADRQDTHDAGQEKHQMAKLDHDPALHKKSQPGIPSNCTQFLIKCRNCLREIDIKMRTKFDMIQHMQSCLDILPFSCSRCGRKCGRIGNMQVHIKTKCPDARVVKMNRCQLKNELQANKWKCFPHVEVDFTRNKALPMMCGLSKEVNDVPSKKFANAEESRQETQIRQLHCQKCEKYIKYALPRGRCIRGKYVKYSADRELVNCTANAVSHVKACLGLRPFACTTCPFISSLKQSLLRHIRAMCPGATIVLVDKLRNEDAIREGLKTCFPVQEFAWNGLKL